MTEGKFYQKMFNFVFPFDVIFILGLVVILNRLKCENVFDCVESDGNSSQSNDNQCNFIAPKTPKTFKKN